MPHMQALGGKEPYTLLSQTIIIIPGGDDSLGEGLKLSTQVAKKPEGQNSQYDHI